MGNLWVAGSGTSKMSLKNSGIGGAGAGAGAGAAMHALRIMRFGETAVGAVGHRISVSTKFRSGPVRTAYQVLYL